MKKLSLLTITVLFILNAAHSAFALTGDEALAKFRARMNSSGKLTGIISWSRSGGETYTGAFKYLSPGKIYVKFSSPAGKTIVSNGKSLWIYSSGSNICGVQDLARGGSGGIAALTSGYFAIVTAQGPGGYTIKLKNNDRSFSEIILMVDSTFFLRKAILKSKNGGTYNFSLSNISTSAAVIPSIFDFNVPSNAQVVKNPLNIK
ncbi:MAG TPA: outer-membrane lipoprotein carrier protein LolA [Spirochaetota bacterium]|nr:outer-membrane lipoprotein carrier protein LolA [Spirochaetota bacterium]HPJ33612.1 outer-membrane lipoprotein carrier protein LolA [Spirochaetota bacterium]